MLEPILGSGNAHGSEFDARNKWACALDKNEPGVSLNIPSKIPPFLPSNDEQASQQASSSNINTRVDSLVKALLPPVDHDDSDEDIVYVKSGWVTPVTMPSKETKVKEEPQETNVSKQTPPLTSVKKEPGLHASTAAASTTDSLPDYGPDMDLQEFWNRFAGGNWKSNGETAHEAG
ncbi:hypothetical protein CF326_g8165 [Tilletia indica]|uniref:Uncharacterized protein n=1 Tax=Tilletia indica TaxID=43049 RepID=A0A177TDL0_9BASI|nr:hypothetical protein CF326_g8165 [Tilletia indica]KAE8239943.1 hypothetical protein A4X13_0g8006 [Tilletia indica]